MHDVPAVLIQEANQEVVPAPDPHVLDVRRPDLVWPAGLLILFSATLATPAPGTYQLRLPQNPVHRRGSQVRHVLVHHPPGQLPVPKLRVLQGILLHYCLLLRQCLVGLHRLGRLRRPGLRPRLLSKPAVVRRPTHTQGRKRPAHRPAAPLPGPLHLLVDPLLQLRRHLPVILTLPPLPPARQAHFFGKESPTTLL